MRPFRPIVALIVAVLPLVLLIAAPPQQAGAATAPASGGALTDGCRSVQDQPPLVGPPTCRSMQSVEWGTAATCRTPLYAAPDATTPEQCAVIDGRPVSDAALAAYGASWVHRALSLQRGLDANAPLLEELFPHTHNSFNASAYRIPTDGSAPSYYATLTNQDPNQVYSITGQLDMDMRAIEIDAHWVPSVYGSAATSGKWVTLCHGNSQQAPATGTVVHIGCSDDRPFEDGLKEIAAWARNNPNQFVLLYIENQLSGDPQAHQVAGDLIKQYLGDLVVPTPAGQPCAPMPADLSRAQLLASGHRLLLVGNCDAGVDTSWGQTVHERGPIWDEHGDPTNYGPAECASDKAARAHDTSFRRYFEDSTWLAAVVGSNPASSSLGGTSTITASTTAAMTRCGVNLIGFDQLIPQDPRLAALVWSWAPNEPIAGAGHCADQGSDARFRAQPCETKHAFACADATNQWHVTKQASSWDKGFVACGKEFPGSRFGAPANGYRNGLIAEAKPTGVKDVWLNYAARGSEAWTPNATDGLPKGGKAATIVGSSTSPSASASVASQSQSTASRRLRPASSVARLPVSAWGLLATALLAIGALTASLTIRYRAHRRKRHRQRLGRSLRDVRGDIELAVITPQRF